MTEKIKVGDIITAYESGYHVVIDTKPGPNGKLVVYRRLLSGAGKPSASSEKTCHIEYCTKITKDKIEDIIKIDLEILEEKAKNLRALIKE